MVLPADSRSSGGTGTRNGKFLTGGMSFDSGAGVARGVDRSGAACGW